jgi:hypothetical protein
MCRRAKMALDPHRPITGRSAPRKKISSPMAEATASTRISAPCKGPSSARRSRCKARPHSKRCVAKRDAKTKPSPIRQPGHDAQQDLGIFPTTHAPDARLSTRKVDHAIPAAASARYRIRTRADRDQLRLASGIASTIAAKWAGFAVCGKDITRDAPHASFLRPYADELAVFSGLFFRPKILVLASGL